MPYTVRARRRPAGNHEPGALHDLGHRSRIRHHHRPGGGHPFERGKPEALVERGGGDDHGRRGEDLLDVLTQAEEVNPRGDPEAFAERAPSAEARTFSDQREVRALADLRKRAQEPLDALLVVEAGHADEERSVAHPQLLANAPPVRPLEPRGLYGIVHHRDLRGRNTVDLANGAGHERRDRHALVEQAVQEQRPDPLVRDAQGIAAREREVIVDEDARAREPRGGHQRGVRFDEMEMDDAGPIEAHPRPHLVGDAVGRAVEIQMAERDARLAQGISREGRRRTREHHGGGDPLLPQPSGERDELLLHAPALLRIEMENEPDPSHLSLLPPEKLVCRAARATTRGAGRRASAGRSR